MRLQGSMLWAMLWARWRALLWTLCGVFGLCGQLAATAAEQAPFPSRPLTLVVPFSAGSSVDLIGRLLAESMAEGLGQPVVVENQPGASGQLAAIRVSRAPADGHTLVLAGDAALVVLPSLSPRADFEPLRDLAPVTQVAVTPNVLLVAADAPWRSVAELIDAARASPGRLSYASAGIGTSQHRGGEALAAAAGVELIHVPYTSAQLQVADVASGRVSFMFANVVNGLAAAQGQRMRALAVSGRTRSLAAPELPTVAESGVPGFEAVAWFGLMVPTGTPAAVIERLHREAAQALNSAAMRERFLAGGAEAVGSSPAAFAVLLREQTAQASARRPKPPGS